MFDVTDTTVTHQERMEAIARAAREAYAEGVTAGRTARAETRRDPALAIPTTYQVEERQAYHEAGPYGAPGSAFFAGYVDGWRDRDYFVAAAFDGTS